MDNFSNTRQHEGLNGYIQQFNDNYSMLNARQQAAYNEVERVHEFTNGLNRTRSSRSLELDDHAVKKNEKPYPRHMNCHCDH